MSRLIVRDMILFSSASFGAQLQELQDRLVDPRDRIGYQDQETLFGVILNDVYIGSFPLKYFLGDNLFRIQQFFEKQVPEKKMLPQRSQFIHGYLSPDAPSYSVPENMTFRMHVDYD